MFNYERLEVYKKALVFIDNIYTITMTWPSYELFGLTNQLRRASTSIALNIAEGSRRTAKDFSHFISLARGSCYECASILDIALMRKYSASSSIDLKKDCVSLAMMLSKLRSSLEKSHTVVGINEVTK